jgi:hypothetical protein
MAPNAPRQAVNPEIQRAENDGLADTVALTRLLRFYPLAQNLFPKILIRT